MQPRRLQKTIAAALAAVILTLATPVTAAERLARRPPRTVTFVKAVQDWLGGWLAGWAGRAPQSELRNVSDEEGLGIDPNGKPIAPPPPTSSGASTSRLEVQISAP